MFTPNYTYTRQERKVPPSFRFKKPPPPQRAAPSPAPGFKRRGPPPPPPQQEQQAAPGFRNNYNKKKRRRKKVKKRKSRRTQQQQKYNVQQAYEKPYYANYQAQPQLYEVASYQGRSVRDLERYLTSGNVDYSSWSKTTLSDLQEQINIGKCELGLDDSGNCLRVANVSKVFIWDQQNNWILFNPVSSYEGSEFVKATKLGMQQKSSNLEQVLTRNRPSDVYYDDGGMNFLFSNNKKRSKNVEIPSSFIFGTIFSAFKENPKEAAARVLSWRLGLRNVSYEIFSDDIPMVKRKHTSTHFPGLNSEYHVYHVKLSQRYIIPLQKMLEVGQMTPMVLDEKTNTGINTHWYCWIKDNDTAEDMVSSLKFLYKYNPKVKGLIGEADFEGGMANAVGMVMREEADELQVWDYE